jgi:hypothetical protein
MSPTYQAALRRFCYPKINSVPFSSIGRSTMQRQVDHSALEMALVGYEAELQKIEAAMATIRKHLGLRGKGARVLPASIRTNGRREMSAEGRKRIAAAQKKRWAVFHAKKRPATRTAKKSTPKRKMSLARRAALAANLAKARAAKAEKATA